MQFAEPLQSPSTASTVRSPGERRPGDPRRVEGTRSLGSGDAVAAFQSFALKQKPLTYVPAAATGGPTRRSGVGVDGVTLGSRLGPLRAAGRATGLRRPG